MPLILKIGKLINQGVLSQNDLYFLFETEKYFSAVLLSCLSSILGKASIILKITYAIHTQYRPYRGIDTPNKRIHVKYNEAI